MFINPWNEKSKRVCDQLKLYGVAYEKPDPIFASNFGKKYKNLFDNGFLDMTTTRYRKRPDKLIFTTPPDVKVFLKNGKGGVNYHFKRLKFF